MFESSLLTLPFLVIGVATIWFVDRRHAKRGQSPFPLPWSSCLLIGFTVAVIVELLK